MSFRYPFAKVVEALATEREYQARRWGVRLPETFEEVPHEIETWLLYMEDYLEEARRAVSPDIAQSKDSVLSLVRKITALGVSCMENHGAPHRDLSQAIVNGRDGQLA